jgi:hypothetical protein
MGGSCSAHWKIRNAYKILVGRPEGKRPLGSRRRKWVDNIEMGLRKIGLESVDWINLAQERDQWRATVNTVMNLRVPQQAGNFLTKRTISFSSRAVRRGVRCPSLRYVQKKKNQSQ